MAEFFDNMADVGSEEEDEDFDGVNGEPKKNGASRVQDSSDEEEDDDEERLREVSTVA
jgi:transcription elongation factor SPT6